MTCANFPNDAGPLVLDTSVLINLHASRAGEQILAALPHRLFVPEIVAAELEHETSRQNGEHSFLERLSRTGAVEIGALIGPEIELFTTLTAISPTLDDGEAATIAVGVTRSLVPVIDERKGRARAAALMPKHGALWSLDLFVHPQVSRALGAESVTTALFSALREARMRVPDDRCDEVVALIGHECALLCHSLPGTKQRRLAQLTE